MAIIERENVKYRKQQIDLSGSQGNAYFLLGTARSLGKQLGFDEEKLQSIRDEMTSSDYENLIKVFDDNFGDYIDLIRC